MTTHRYDPENPSAGGVLGKEDFPAVFNSLPNAEKTVLLPIERTSLLVARRQAAEDRRTAPTLVSMLCMTIERLAGIYDWSVGEERPDDSEKSDVARMTHGEMNCDACGGRIVEGQAVRRQSVVEPDKTTVRYIHEDVLDCSMPDA